MIDWKQLSTKSEFYTMFLEQVDAPNWHGRNLDALYDGLLDERLIKLTLPVCFVNKNSSSVKLELECFQQSVFELVDEVASQRKGISLLIEA
ncbi:barstar family protein [uncultured Photobacterium sp.]|uniref:barstar family protein n=1 Tax=uncultured Photobacterium sp. TaxID=173973 RepID=UPI0026158C47|nr:barstar family protein [uncultured Photobacterium sp.]